MKDFSDLDHRKIIKDYLRLRAEQDVSADEILGFYEQQLADLRKEFQKVKELDSLRARTSAARTTDEAQGEPIQPHQTTVQIRCPHCAHPRHVPLSESVSRLQVFRCHECNQDFRLERERKWPSQIDQYQLIDRLGRGGFGIVWKAWDTQLKRHVALKLPRLRSDEGDAGKFLAEARTAAGLKHRHIVQVHDVGSFEDEFYIASELIDGSSLSNHIGDGLPELEAIRMAQCLASALSYAHASGVIHRDVKSQNVLVNHQGEPFLTDFGLAGNASIDATVTLNSTGEEIGGSPAYMAPEQARGHRVDERSDIYSLGVVLYEMLTGQVPFRGNLGNVLRRLDNEEPDRPRKLNSKISPDAEVVCLKCLEKDPNKRFQNARELGDELQRIRERRPILSRPAGRAERILRWTRRNPRLAAWSSIAVICLLAVAWLLVDRVIAVNIRESELRSQALTKLQAFGLRREMGYREDITAEVKRNPSYLATDYYHSEAKRHALSSMGDFVGYHPKTFQVEKFFKPSEEGAVPPEGIGISSSAINGDGCLIAIGLNDGRLFLRNRETFADLHGEIRPSYSFSNDHLIGLRFLSDERLLAVSQYGAIYMTTLRDDRVEIVPLSYPRHQTLDQPETDSTNPPASITAVGFCPDGEHVGIADNDSIQIFRISPNVELIFHRELQDLGRCEPQGLAMSSQLGLVAMSYCDDVGSISGLQCWQGDAEAPVFHTKLSGQQFTNALAISACGTQIITGGNRVMRFDSQNDFRAYQVRSDGTDAKALASHPHEKYYAIVNGSDEVTILNAKSLEILARYEAESTGKLSNAQFSTNGRILLTANRRQAHVVDFAACPEKKHFAGHSSGIPSVRFTRDGRQLVSSGEDGFVRIWDHDSTSQLAEHRFHSKVQCAELCRNDQWLVTAEWGEDPTLTIWAFPDLQKICEVPHTLSNIASVACSHDSQRLAACGEYGVCVWKIQGTISKPRFTLVFQECDGDDSSDMGRKPGVNAKCLLFTKDDRRLFYVDNWRHVRTVEFEQGPNASRAFRSADWDVENGYGSLALSPGGKLLFVDFQRDNRIGVFDATSSTRWMSHPFSEGMQACAIRTHPLGRLAALPSAKVIGIWDLKSNRKVYELPEESEEIWTFDWSPSGEELAIGMANGDLVVWDLLEIDKQLAKIGFEIR